MDENTKQIVASNLTDAYFSVFPRMTLEETKDAPQTIMDIYSMFRGMLEGSDSESGT